MFAIRLLCAKILRAGMALGDSEEQEKRKEKEKRKEHEQEQEKEQEKETPVNSVYHASAWLAKEKLAKEELG